MKTPPFYDRMDNLIEVGDVLVYANLLGRCARTSVGVVLEIKPKEPDRRGNARTSIKIRSFQDGFHAVGGQYVNSTYAKDVWLHETDRVLRYDRKYLSKEVRVLLGL